MHRMRVYVDTSVFGGAFDEQFAEPSRLCLDHVKQGRYIVLVSAVTFGELQGAPNNVRQLIEDMPVGSLEKLP